MYSRNPPWKAGVAGGTPVTAVALEKIESGIEQADVTNPASDAKRWSDSAYARQSNELVNARTSFGAVGDGVADDTDALQRFVTYCQVNHRAGVIPAGTYKITAPLRFSSVPGWSVVGAGPYVTTIKQYTDNVAIFNLGSDTVSYMHSMAIRDMSFNYATDQPATNTDAAAILLSTMVFQSAFTNLQFNNSAFGFRMADGIGCPWGTTFDDLRFGGAMTVGAMDWSRGVNGVPNNRFGRILADCANMIGPVFSLRGYNFQIDTIEFIAANKGANLLTLQAGGKVNIGTMKLENGIYAANKSLWNFEGKSNATIGNLTVGGNAMKVTGGLISALRVDQGFVDVGYMEVELSEAAANGGQMFATSSSGALSIGRYVSTSGFTAGLHNAVSTEGGNFVTVRDQVTGRLSNSRPDSDYTIVRGDPNIVAYQTAFAAPRTLTLPSDSPNMFNGLYYEIVISGAVNGSNTLTIKAGTTTLRVETADKVSMRYVWRRHSSGALGWVLTRYGLLP